MSETDKLRIKPLDDKSDYSLWRIRVEAACSAKGLDNVLLVEEPERDTAESDIATFKAHQMQASNIMVGALSDHPLRVVRTVIGKPYQMLAKLDARYDSKSTSSKISKMSDLVSMRYSTLKEDISKHIDRMRATTEQLANMGTIVQEPLAIGILVASIDVTALRPVTAAIKTLAERDLTWDTVTERLIEEAKSAKADLGGGTRATVANSTCQICDGGSHSTAECFENPRNPANKLSLENDRAYRNRSSQKKGGKGTPSGGSVDNSDAAKRAKKYKKGSSQRAAMARHGQQPRTEPDKMLLDSGTTSHMTPKTDRVGQKAPCNTSIALGDDSTVRAFSKGTRNVKWQTDDGPVQVALSNTLVAEDLSLSLLSVPALVNKEIAVIFVPGQALLVDLQDDFRTIATAVQDQDGLFYIADRQETVPDIPGRNMDGTVRAMMAITRKAVSDKSTVQICAAGNGTGRVAPYKRDPTGSIDTESEYNYSSADVSGKVDSDGEEESSGEPSEYKTESDNVDTRSHTPNKTDSGVVASVPRGPVAGCNRDPATVWHDRLGHALSIAEVRRLVRSGQLPRPICSRSDCTSCTKGKFRKRFAGSLTKEVRIGRLHADVKGKIKTPTVDGQKYFVSIVDEASRYTFVKPMRKKGEASDVVLEFAKWFERQSGRSVFGFHTDGGGEFKKALRVLSAQGVDVSFTTGYTPQSNGLAERTHGIVLSMARSCLVQAKLPMRYWGFAVRHVADCKNNVPHSATKKVPVSVIQGSTSPSVEHLRPFGSRMLYQPVQDRLPPLASRLKEGICLLHEGGGIYRVLTAEGIVRTKHVHSYESEFPGLSYIQNGPVPTDETNTDYGDTDDDYVEVSIDDTADSEEEISQVADADGQVDQDDDSDSIDDADEGDANAGPGDALTHFPAQPSTFDNETYEDAPQEVQAESDHGEDLDVTVQESPDSDSDVERPTRGPYNLRTRTYCAFHALPKSISTSDAPTVSQALKSAERTSWTMAIKEEFSMLLDSKTWVQCGPPPPRSKVLPSGFVLLLKRDAEGRPKRFKARLVARGNFQADPDNYAELYAPVADIELVRTLMAVAVAQDWCCDHMDIKGAFLCATLPEKDIVYIRLPSIPGIASVNGQVVLLRRSLYGLRQAAKLWYGELCKTLERIGLRRSQVSECLFISATNEKIYVVVYVDDLLIIGTSPTVEKFKKAIARSYTVSDLGNATYYLGVKIERDRTGIFLSQQALAEKIVRLAGLSECKPTMAPLPMSHPLYETPAQANDTDEFYMRTVPYREVLGALLYISTRTRPDIATAVSLLGKYQAAPCIEHWKSLKTLVRYVHGTINYGLFIPRGDSTVVLKAWTDADWGRDHDNRRSRSGYIVTLNDAPVLWRSKQQTATALSTTEAEFYSLSLCVREVIWLRMLLTELGLPQDKPTVMFQDNLGTIKWTESVQGLRNVKHVGIRYHYVREAVESSAIIVQYVSTLFNRADSLTKALIGDIFVKHRKWLGVDKLSNLTGPRGGVSQ